MEYAQVIITINQSTFFSFSHFFRCSLIVTRPAWGYKCEQDVCKKVELTDDNLATAISLPVCRMFCGEDIGTIWPKPTSTIKISNEVVKIDPNTIAIETGSFKKAPAFWAMAESRFHEMQLRKKPEKVNLEHGGKQLKIEVSSESDEMGEWHIAFRHNEILYSNFNVTLLFQTCQLDTMKVTV